MTPSAAQALSILRDTTQFSWYVIPFLLIAIYIYAVEIGKKNWSVVFAGLALWGMDWFNEIWNSLVFHFSGYAPVWGAPGDTAYLILIGLNIEICFMFLIMGVATVQLLPADRNLKILKIPNRIFFAVVNSILCVLVEIILNAGGWLTWDYSLWQASFPFFIFLVGYLPFFIVAFLVFDMETVKKKAITTGAILGFDLAALILFGPILGWI